MAYDTYLAERVRNNLRTNLPVEEKGMFGGLTFMVDDKMCLGIVKDELMVRFDPEKESEVYAKKGARPMDFTSRPMVGFALVNQEGIDRQDDLDYWINLALEYNKIAKPSKKRRKK